MAGESSTGQFERGKEFPKRSRGSGTFRSANPMELPLLQKKFKGLIVTRCTESGARRLPLVAYEPNLPVGGGNSIGTVHHFTGHGHEFF